MSSRAIHMVGEFQIVPMLKKVFDLPSAFGRDAGLHDDNSDDTGSVVMEAGNARPVSHSFSGSLARMFASRLHLRNSRALRIALFAALYVPVAMLSMQTATLNRHVSPIWLPAGLSLGILLLFGDALWPGIVIGAAVANLANGASLATSVWLAVANAAQALIASHLLLRHRDAPRRLESVAGVFALLGLGAALGPTVGATLGVVSLCATGAAPWSAFAMLWAAWWLSDSISVVLLTSVVLFVRREPLGGARAAEATLLAFSTAAVAGNLFFGLVWLGPLQGPYVILPLMIWAAVRFQLRGAAMASLLVALIGISATMLRIGPFASGLPDVDLEPLQAFLSLAALTTLLLGASVAEEKRASENLKRAHEQLVQAQKMEAVGRLAAGVAHDFKNLLMVIGGFSALLKERFAADPRAAPLEDVLKATERATVLTRQLLASSGRQVLEIRSVRLDSIVADTARMLERLIGKDIELSVALPARHALVKADPSQIEQVILNLGLNARDAMPRGGRLTIALHSEVVTSLVSGIPCVVPPGRYARLMVVDTGVGMDSRTVSRIFEPFFTTKEPGKGTGLGLSTVYGIVSQSGGYLQVTSSPGRGSSFHVYLPQSTDAHSFETRP